MSEGKQHDCPYCGKRDCQEWQHARDEADYWHDVWETAQSEFEQLQNRLPMSGEGIQITVHCADCDASATMDWPDGEYHATLERRVTLDGRVQMPKGWYAVPGAYGGDNKLRCPIHAKVSRDKRNAYS